MFLVLVLNSILAFLSALFLLSKRKVVFSGGNKLLMSLGFFLEFLGLSVANAIQTFDLSSYFLWIDWDVVFIYAFFSSPVGGVLVCLAVIYAVVKSKPGKAGHDPR